MNTIETVKDIPNSFENYQEFESYKERCRCCTIGKIYNRVVLSDGNKKNPKIIMIGESAGSTEIEMGKPFVGKAGKLLRSTIKEFGFSSKNSLITNLMPCRPENNKFPNDSNIINNCKNMWLKKELYLTNPDFIVLIGAKPLKYLLKMDGITKLRGQWFKRKLNGKAIWIMPVCHPSFVLRKQYMEDGNKIAEDFRSDFKNIALKAGLD